MPGIVLGPGDTAINKVTEFLLSRRSQSSRSILLLLLSLKYLFMAKRLKWDSSTKIYDLSWQNILEKRLGQGGKSIE